MTEEKGNFSKYDKVLTVDGVILGDLLRIHHRLEEVNPLLQLYGRYLEIWSVELGGRAYIPTDFIESYDQSAGAIYLDVSLKTVQEQTWDRTPEFIARRQSRREELPLAHARSIVA